MGDLVPSTLKDPAYCNVRYWDNGRAVLAVAVGHGLPSWFSWLGWPRV